MRTILVGCELSYDVHHSTVFLLRMTASWTPHQKLTSEQLDFAPVLDVETCQVGSEGNRLHQVVVEPCRLQISYRATVELTPEVNAPADLSESMGAQLPADVLPYMNPSRYCESDLLARFAFEKFGQLRRGYQRVQAICDWVNGHLDYVPGSTNAMTTAADVLLLRTGVCRDYAHLAISLCRGVGIPARYVSGYAVDLQPPDYHGFMEAFLNGRWYLFDPSELVPVTGLVRIGTGRDAADAAFATLTGNAVLTQKGVWALDADNAEPDVIKDHSAISTA